MHELVRTRVEKTYRMADVFGGEVHNLLIHGPFFITFHDGFLKRNYRLAYRHSNVQPSEEMDTLK